VVVNRFVPFGKLQEKILALKQISQKSIFRDAAHDWIRRESMYFVLSSR